ncbi:MAG: dTDP-4-dehydrorhamnose 3,5-epimerase [Gemmatimonadetes bacterium]|nr:dTDP-4-dehydrorhamnose 3,5-epimerase [Gemmatimonadota bacterium]
MSFRFAPHELAGVVLIEETRRGDARGFFAETFKESVFRAAGIPGPFVQDNHARSARGVLRGLHYQLPPKAQGKLIRVVRGEVFDVAVDLRRGSPTFGGWAGVHLSGDEPRMLWVPAGFAHGYVVLSESADFTYKVTAEYDGALERGVRWDDPAIGVAWPGGAPILSDRDVLLPPLAEAENPFVFPGARP